MTRPSFDGVGRLARAVRVALVVGTLLTAFYQGSAALGLPHQIVLGMRVVFSYFVPFAVSLYSTRAPRT